MTEFIQQHWLDITTTVFGLAYILLEYKASVWLWLVGFVMQALDIVLYYDKGLYADCGMEFYYIAMTVYGFVTWKYYKDKNNQKKEMPVTHFKRNLILPWTVATLILWAVISWLLITYTDSNVPLADGFTTALSFVGIWALARKHLEQWLIWIAVDIVTCGLYIYKDIPFKASLYALYVIIAVMGYKKWRQMMQNDKKHI